LRARRGTADEPFDYISVLLSIVLSLALAHVLASTAHVIQHGIKRWSGLLAFWTGIVVFMMVDFWLSVWQLHEQAAWSLPFILFLLFQASLIYVTARLATPDGAAGQPIDMVAHFEATRRRFFEVLGTLHAARAGGEPVHPGLRDARAEDHRAQLFGAVLHRLPGREHQRPAGDCGDHLGDDRLLLLALHGGDMTRRQITGFSNPTVKYLRSLRDKKHRRRERKFLAEGLRLLTEARESGRLPEMLVMAKDARRTRCWPRWRPTLSGPAARSSKPAARSLPRSPARTIRRPSPACSPSSIPRSPRLTAAPRRSGWSPRRSATRQSRHHAAHGRRGGRGRADPARRQRRSVLVEAVRASMGAIFTQQVCVVRWEEFIVWLRSGPGPAGRGEPARRRALSRGALRSSLLHLVGNESRGLPEEYEAACDLARDHADARARDSLNAAIAGAVLAYEVLAKLEV
jgi:TrmH family RNA methyltransferase